MANTGICDIKGVNIHNKSQLNKIRKKLIGRIVYPPYKPGQLRKVTDCYFGGQIDVHGISIGNSNLLFGDVVGTDGQIHKGVPLYAYGDYQLLIDDHQRKADKHKKKLEDALAKFDEIGEE